MHAWLNVRICEVIVCTALSGCHQGYLGDTESGRDSWSRCDRGAVPCWCTRSLSPDWSGPLPRCLPPRPSLSCEPPWPWAARRLSPCSRNVSPPDARSLHSLQDGRCWTKTSTLSRLEAHQNQKNGGSECEKKEKVSKKANNSTLDPGIRGRGSEAGFTWTGDRGQNQEKAQGGNQHGWVTNFKRRSATTIWSWLHTPQGSFALSRFFPAPWLDWWDILSSFFVCCMFWNMSVSSGGIWVKTKESDDIFLIPNWCISLIDKVPWWTALRW